MSYGHRRGSESLAIYIIKQVQVKHHIAHTSIYIPGTFNHSNIIHWLKKHAKIIHLSIQNSTNELVSDTGAISNLKAL
jgi:hypothetical protein